MTEDNTARSLKPVEKPKTSDEVFEAEFARFLDAFEIMTDNLDAEDRAAFQNRKETILFAMRKGRLTFNEKGVPEYKPGFSQPDTPITLDMPKGSAFMAMDRRKHGEDVTKTYVMWGEAFHQPANRFSEMDQRDLRVVAAVASLFLG